MSLNIFPRHTIPLDGMTAGQLEDEKRFVEERLEMLRKKMTLDDNQPKKELGFIKLLRKIDILLLNK